MMPLYFQNLAIWQGERIGGNLYAHDIANWSDAELSAIDLYRSKAPEVIPEGMRLSGSVEWDGESVRYVLEDMPEPPRRTIRKSLVKQRLIDLGLMDAAYAALTADPVSFARWFDMDYPEVNVDDPDALALLTGIGADPEVIMAPE